MLVFPDGIRPGSLLVEDGKIAEISEKPDLEAEAVYDACGWYVSPGFIDMHVHGGGGYDFMDGTAEAMLGAARLHMKHGTTLLLPTTVACTDEELESVFSALREARNSPEVISHLYGIHLEGPYLSPQQAGAIDPVYLRHPDKEHVEHLLKIGGEDIKRITLACELPGAMEMCDLLRSKGIVLSLGHTDAEYSEIYTAVEHGCSHVTHLYSAMSTLHRRNAYRYLGLVESSYLMDELTVEIIADGKHLPSELLKLITRQKAMASISLITDAVRGAGQPDGSIIRLGSVCRGQDAVVRDGVAFVMDGSCFAGSVCTADRCIRTMRDLAGLELHQAVTMITYNPARVLGLEKQKGLLRPGHDADLCVFDENIHIKDVFISGRQAAM